MMDYLDDFINLPYPVRVLISALSVTTILGIAAMIDRSVLWIVGIGLLVILLSLFLYLRIRKWRDKRRAAALGGQLAQNSATAPQGVSDPARRAKLDDLRQNFQKGVDKFRSAGKDLYSLPWYMVVGEPGSGKTEAIRHCNVGFPPGLQDEMQGAGGTINMHWWFTNQAVMLDTAGKLLFQEAPPGTTTEWAEFLNLLRKNRANCPINGLLLVIPADSLIKDSGDEIARKAGKIAEQLDRIQRTLDVRFPVFVLVTKCDLVNGFREFFAGLKDPQLQHQMMGWSNPDALDTAFRPELVDQHLDQVCQRLRRRRLGLLRDPVAETPGGRRADEVDALYALPHSLASLAPRLRRYLEMIFVAGEWSAKPLFLRGIYFTSALTEGQALDLEIAQAMGVAPDALPEGKAWERERSFFLRDLFMQKIFKERGLVTRATNTRQLLRRRQMILGSVGVLGLAVVLGFSFFGARAVKRSVGGERAMWTAAAAGWQAGDLWNPILSPEFKGSTKFVYNGANTVDVGGDAVPLVEFHSRLRDLVSHDIPVPFVFKPLEALVVRANANRRQAQRVVFEDSVVLPAVQAGRARLENPDGAWTPYHTASLALFVQLEGMIRKKGGLLGRTAEFTPEGFLNPLIGPWAPGGKAPDALLSVFEWTYYKGGDGRKNWPGPAFSAGASFRENKPIATGWDSFQKFAHAGVKSQQKGSELMKEIRVAALEFRQAEQDFLHFSSSRPTAPGWREEVGERFDALDQKKVAMADLRRQMADSNLLPPGAFSLAGAYKALVEGARAQSEAGLKSFREVIRMFAPPKLEIAGTTMPSLGDLGDSDFTLLRDVATRVDRLDQEMTAEAKSTFSDSDQLELPGLDRRLFGEFENQPLYLWRWQYYHDAVALLRPAPGLEKTIVGSLAKTLEDVAAGGAALAVRAEKYEADGRAEFQPAARNLAAAAQPVGGAALFALHADAVAKFLKTTVGFPLIFDVPDRPMSVAALKETDKFLRAARADLQVRAIPDAARDTFALTNRRVSRLLALLDGLVTGDGDPAPVKVLLPPYADQRKGILDRGLTQTFAANFAGNLWRSLRVDGRAFRTQVPADTEIARVLVSDSLPPLELFLAADVKPDADARYAFEPGWSVFRQLRTHAIRRANGKDWEGVVQLKDDTGADQFLLLLFAFDKPLPEMAEWPTMDSLQLR